MRAVSSAADTHDDVSMASSPAPDELATARELVRLLQACGVSFADTADGVLRALTKTVVETALEELADHLGYDKHDPAGRNGANSRNGTRTNTVLTDTVGQIDIESQREMWRLLTLETRMESCRVNSHQGSRPHVGTAGRRTPLRSGRSARWGRAELGTEHGTVYRVARQRGYGVESVRSWVRQADIDDGYEPGVTTTESARVKELAQEIRELKRANEILKRAACRVRHHRRPSTVTG